MDIWTFADKNKLSKDIIVTSDKSIADFISNNTNYCRCYCYVFSSIDEVIIKSNFSGDDSCMLENETVYVDISKLEFVKELLFKYKLTLFVS